MGEICASGSVGGEGGNILVYPATWPAMPREKAQAAPTARLKVPMRRRGADCPVVATKRVMPAEQRGRVIAVELGPTGSNREEPDGSAEGGSLRAMARAG